MEGIHASPMVQKTSGEKQEMSNAQVKAIVFSNIGSACLLGGIYVESKGDYVWAFLLFASFLLNMHTVYRLLIEGKE